MKGGVLLYALVIALIFGLLLQFYLQNQVETKRHQTIKKDYLTAQLMVALAKKEQPEEKILLQFHQGEVRYQMLKKDENTVIARFDVVLKNGKNFTSQIIK